MKTILGTRGNDYLDAGFEFNVIMRGGKGADTLNGGPGSDTLFGGKGRDKFVFDDDLSPRNVDSVADFQHGKDKIVLDLEVFGRVRTPDWFGKVVNYDKVSGELSYLGDTFAVLRGDVHLTEHDFLFVS